VLVDHCLIAIIKHELGGSLSVWRSTGSLSSLGYNLALAVLGVVIALIWAYDSWLALFAIAPLVLAQRSLTVPRLQEEARVDPRPASTTRATSAVSSATSWRARSATATPLSVLMIDLDLLREINNTYGHLAGDAILCAVADVFRSQLRHYDVAARFGGEEFSILLPETPVEKALEIAERIRRAVAERSVDVSTSSEPIHATVSIGVASFPATAPTRMRSSISPTWPFYRAKLQGRNRVQAASAEETVLAPSLSGHLEVAAQIAEHDERTALSAEGNPRPRAAQNPYFLSLSFRLATIVALISTTGIAAGVAAVVFSHVRSTGVESSPSPRWSEWGRRSPSRSTTARSRSARSARSPASLCSTCASHFCSRLRPAWWSGARADRRCTRCSSTSAG